MQHVKQEKIHDKIEKKVQHRLVWGLLFASIVRFSPATCVHELCLDISVERFHGMPVRCLERT